MKETDQDLAGCLAVQLSLLKLIAGTEEGLPERTLTEPDARALEQFVRVVKPGVA